jgi:hypothetical protein
MSTKEMWCTRSGERWYGINVHCRVPHKDPKKRMIKLKISGQVKGRPDTDGRYRYSQVLVPRDVIGFKKKFSPA